MPLVPPTISAGSRFRTLSATTAHAFRKGSASRRLVAVTALTLCIGLGGLNTTDGSGTTADTVPASQSKAKHKPQHKAQHQKKHKSGGKAQTLAGRTIVLDPVGQLGNRGFRGRIERKVPAGGFEQKCNDVGPSVRGGMPEATITWKTAQELKRQLRQRGATVVLTRSSNTAGKWGPCVDKRGRIGNSIGADLKLSLQADVSRPDRGGFYVMAPTNRAPWTDDIYTESLRLAETARDSLSASKIAKAKYRAGKDGVQMTSKLATLNLSDVPAIAVSLGNVANRGDARRMTTAKGQSNVVHSLLHATQTYLGVAKAASTQAPLGVQVFSMWRDWDDHVKLMDAVVAAGSKWIRVDVGWCSLEEAGPGITSQWYQDRLDTTIADARARGLALLVTLGCSPTWAAPGGQIANLPNDPAQYARIAGFLANRYRGQVAAWEIWNEPDCLQGGCPQGSPEAYATLLKAAYPAVKAADPAATVMNGGLSGIDLGWIKRFLATGAGDYLDALALHPYLAPAAAAPDLAPTQGFSNPYRITNVSGAHDLLASTGHPGTPIWFTEFGWTTGRTANSPYDGVSPQTQADYLTQAMALVRTKYPYVAAAFWYTMRDRDDSSVYENGFGLLNLDSSKKPAYAAFAAANKP